MRSRSNRLREKILEFIVIGSGIQCSVSDSETGTSCDEVEGLEILFAGADDDFFG